MIRLAYLGVLIIAGLLAYGAFALIRGAETPAEIAITTTEEDLPVLEPEADSRFYFLADQDLDTGQLALVLYRAGPDGNSVVVTDPDALKAAQSIAYVNTDATAGEAAGSIVLGVLGVPVEERIAALFRDDELILEVRCGSTTCGPHAIDEDIDFAGLLDASRPLPQIEESYDNYDAYLDALAFIKTTPEFALLDLQPSLDQTYPVAQQTPTGLAALPTIYRFADDPLDIDAHSSELSALISEALPEGVSLSNLTIEEHPPAIVVDRDNRRPATRGGAEIPFDQVRFYTPKFDITGAAALPEDLLETLTEETLQRVDWDDAAAEFIASLGFPCPDCYTIQIKGDVFNRAVVYHGRPEYYYLTFYDLRDAP